MKYVTPSVLACLLLLCAAPAFALKPIFYIEKKEGDGRKKEEQAAPQATGAQKASGTADLAEDAWERGRRLLGKKEPEAALSAFQEALAKRPDDWRFHLGRAEALSALGRIRDSLAAFKAAGDRAAAVKAPAPDQAGIWTSMSDVSGQLGLYAESLDQARRAELLWQGAGAGDDPRAAAALASVSLACLGLKQYDKALDYARRALAVESARPDPDWSLRAHRQMAVGRVLERQGRYDEALAAFAEAEATLASRLGKDAPDMAYVFGDRARVSLETGRPAEARDGYDRALAVLDRHPGFNERIKAGWLLRRGLALADLGDFAAAQQSVEAGRDLTFRLFGQENSDAADAWRALGTVSLRAGRNGQAAECFAKALDLDRRIWGKSDPDTILDAVNLGTAEALTGKESDALWRFDEALAELRRQKSPDRRLLAHCLRWQGRIYASRNLLDEARAAFDKALEEGSAAYGPQGAETAKIRAEREDALSGRLWKSAQAPAPKSEAASAAAGTAPSGRHRPLPTGPAGEALTRGFDLLAQHDYQAARQAFEQAKAAAPNEARAFLGLGRVLTGLKKYDEAVNVLMDGQVAAQLAGDEPSEAGIWFAMGEAKSRMKDRLRDATGCFKQALDMDRRLFGEQSVEAAGDMEGLGMAYYRAADFRRALPLVDDAVQIFLAAYGPDHERTAVAYSDLALVYAGYGIFDQAREYAAKAVAILERLGRADSPNGKTIRENLAVMDKEIAKRK